MGWFWSGKCRSSNRLDGKTAIITGSNTGIGKLTALDFYKRGCLVVMACRNSEKAEEAAAWIKKQAETEPKVGQLSVMQLDLSSLASVRDFASQFHQKYSQLHLLVNNAGVMMCPYQKTEDGYEMQFATNHLGHFLLTLLLMRTILSSAPARIINVSSLAHKYTSSMSFDDINMEKKYTPTSAYARSKLANVLFTNVLAEKLKGTNVNVYSLHPGVINTELSRHMDSISFSGARRLYNLFSWFMKTPLQGAQTTIYCAVDDACANQTGLYYDDCHVACTSSPAKDAEMAKQLWLKSLEMVGISSDTEYFKSS